MSANSASSSEPSRSLPYGVHDVKVNFPPSRHPSLPEIREMVGHPLHRGGGRAYYFIHDGTFESACKVYRLEVEELKIPQGPRHEAIDMGYMELLPGDIMFSRLCTAPADGTQDVAVAWVTGSDLYTSDMIAKAIAARDKVLGPRELRTRSHAILDPSTGKKVGGTEWERLLKGTFDEKRGRCYPFGCTYQRQRSIYSPCAAGKVSTSTEDERSMRNDLAEAILDLSIMSFEQGPSEIIEAVKLNHEIFNTPCVGSTKNYAFTSNQLNLAPVREWKSDESLADTMGIKFGGAHIDRLDSPGHYTNMVSLSDLPDGCDPGRFFIVYPGIFVTLDNCVSMNFSGLRVHGGSPPIAAEHTTKEELRWAARVIGVGYDKTGPTSADHKMPLMQIEPDSVLSITPELLREGEFKLDKKFNISTFVTEGPTIMSPASIVGFLVRCLLLLAVTMVSQLPPKLSVKLDSDAFIASFSFADRDGTRKRLTPWEDGPGWRRKNTAVGLVEYGIALCDDDDLVDQTEHTVKQRERWKTHQKKYGGHIPSVVCCVPGIPPLEGWSEREPIKKIKPILFEHEKNRKKKPKKDKGNGKKVAEVETEFETSDDEDGGEWPATPVKKRKTKKPRTTRTKRGKNKKATNKGKGKADDVPGSNDDDDDKVIDTSSKTRSARRTTKNIKPGTYKVDNAPSTISGSKSVRSKGAAGDKAKEKERAYVVLDPNMDDGDEEWESDNDKRNESLGAPRQAPVIDISPLSIGRANGRVSHINSGAADHVQQVNNLADYRMIRMPPVVALPRDILSERNSIAADGGRSSISMESLFGNDVEGELPEVVVSDETDKPESPVHPTSESLQSPIIVVKDSTDHHVSVAQPHPIVNPVISSNAHPPAEPSTRPKKLAASVQYVLGRQPAPQPAAPINLVITGNRKRSLSDPDYGAGQVAGPSSNIDVRESKKARKTSKPRPYDSGGKNSELTEEDLLELERIRLEFDMTSVSRVPGIADSMWSSTAFFSLQSGLTGQTGRVSETGYWGRRGVSKDAMAVIQTVQPPEAQWTDNLEGLPNFLRDLKATTIRAEVESVQDAVIAIAVQKTAMKSDNIALRVSTFHASINSEPLNRQTLPSIQNMWAAVTCLDLDRKSNSLRMRNIASCIMTTHCVAWKWLTLTIPASVSNIIQDPNGTHPAWLWRLVTRIQDSISLRRGDVYFDPKSYYLELAPRHVASVNFHGYLAFRREDVKAWTTVITDVVQNILKIWLNYPSDQNSQWKALYAVSIVETLGPEFLYLNCVWDRYTAATASLMRYRVFSPNLDIARYPLLDASSELRTGVKTIASLIDDYNSGRLYRYVDLSSGFPTISYASEALKDTAERRGKEFMVFMADMFRILFRDEAVGHPEIRKRVREDPDRYSPYREHAPTRSNLTRDKTASPFHPPHLRTKIGVFSALVSRGITFGTLFARHGRTVFTSPSDFDLAVSHLKDVKLYCDMGAYGSDNPKRKPALAQVYWDRLSKHPWAGIEATEKVPFREAYEFFHPPVGRVHFPEVGELAAFLLTGDYVYAGLVEKPTAEYLGKVIFDLNKEPARVLEYLCLVDKRPSGRIPPTKRKALLDQYAVAVESAFTLVKNSLPLDYHEWAGLDLLVTEHSLCKFGRSNKACSKSS